MIRRLLAAFLLTGGVVAGSFAFGPAASAQFNPLDNACTGDAAQSDACKDKDDTDSITGRNGVIVRVTNLLALISGIVAVIAMVIYGIMIIASYGDSAKVTQARNAIIGIVIGLVVILLARTIVVFVVNRL